MKTVTLSFKEYNDISKSTEKLIQERDFYKEEHDSVVSEIKNYQSIFREFQLEKMELCAKAELLDKYIKTQENKTFLQKLKELL